VHALDWTMVCAYFALMIVIGWWSHKRVSDFTANQTVLVATPILVSLALYIGLRLIAPERSAAADEIVDTVNTDDDVDRTREGTTVPA